MFIINNFGDSLYLFVLHFKGLSRSRMNRLLPCNCTNKYSE